MSAPTVHVPARALSPAELLDVVRGLAGRRDEWLERVRHDSQERWFERVTVSDDHDVWLIGWDSYQGVDLHDHGGSNGVLYVVDGELRETSTRREGGVRLLEQQLPAGTARAFGAGHVHRVVNPSATPATSLHVYSRPLVGMDFYATGGGVLDRTHSEAAFEPRSGRGELR
jgi:hypothetical protein